MSKDEVTRAVGRQVAAMRRAAALSQVDLARRLEMPRDTLAHYESGRRPITVAWLSRAAAALGVTPALFLLEDEALAGVLRRLVNDPAALDQVRFFLDVLDNQLLEEGDASEPFAKGTSRSVM